MGNNEGVLAIVVGAVMLLILGAIVAGSPGGGSGSVSHPHRSDSISIDSNQAAQSSQRQNDEANQQLNRITESMDSVEEQLEEIERTVHDAQNALNDIKRNAQTAHVGGQMNDFRMWQQIGREKKSSIEEASTKAENAIAAARRGAESDLQRINWGTSGEKERHLSQVNQRISQLKIRASNLEKLSGEIAQHNKWLEASE